MACSVGAAGDDASLSACSIAPVIRPVTSSGELAAIALVGDLAAAAQHDDAVGDARRRRACGG